MLTFICSTYQKLRTNKHHPNCLWATYIHTHLHRIDVGIVGKPWSGSMTHLGALAFARAYTTHLTLNTYISYR